MINTFFDKIFYINLSRDINRDKAILAQFKELGITNYERIDAVETLTVQDPITYRNFIKKNTQYVLNSIGCRYSHLKAIRLAKERDYKRILILEDDVVFLYNPNDILQRNKSTLDIADMAYFGGLIEPHYRGQVVEAHAYVVTDKLYDDILEMAIPSGMEIDNFYAKIVQHMSYNYNPRGQYNVVMLQPFNSIVQNKSFESNIQAREDLIQLTELIKPYFTPKSFMEVGSRDGSDTKYVCDYWKLNSENAIIVEANRECYQNIQESMKGSPYAKLIFGAASNYNGEIEFNCVISSDLKLVGISSIKKSIVVDNLKYEQEKVPCFRLEEIIRENSIDLIKIDVEGCSFEVLEGMGTAIENVKAIQVETELIPNFDNQKLDREVNDYLINFGFELISKEPCWASQFDCLYINKNIK